MLNKEFHGIPELIKWHSHITGLSWLFRECLISADLISIKDGLTLSMRWVSTPSRLRRPRILRRPHGITWISFV